MEIKERIKKTISDMEKNITKAKEDLKNPCCHNRTGKIQSIKDTEEMILDFKKVLEGMKNGK